LVAHAGVHVRHVDEGLNAPDRSRPQLFENLGPSPENLGFGWSNGLVEELADPGVAVHRSIMDVAAAAGA
jgi:hypothetical protein